MIKIINDVRYFIQSKDLIIWTVCTFHITTFFINQLKCTTLCKKSVQKADGLKENAIHSLGPLSYARFSQKSKPKLHACLRKTVANFA